MKLNKDKILNISIVVAIIVLIMLYNYKPKETHVIATNKTYNAEGTLVIHTVVQENGDTIRYSRNDYFNDIFRNYTKKVK